MKLNEKGKTSLMGIVMGIVLVLSGAVQVGCNRTIIDLTYKYDYAYLELPTGVIVEGKVENWTDYEGDQLQISIGGKTYLTHSNRVVLIKN